MGGACQFFRTLTRKPLPAWARFSGASGPHRGIDAPNMPREIMLACVTGEGVDVDAYIALHTILDLDGLFDLIELGEVGQSWKHAGAANAARD